MSNNIENNKDLKPVKKHLEEYKLMSEELPIVLKKCEKLNADIVLYQRLIALSKAKQAMGSQFDSFEKVYSEYEKIQTESKIGEKLIKDTIYLNTKNAIDIENLKNEIVELKKKKIKKKEVLSSINAKEKELSKLEEIRQQNESLLKKVKSPLSSIVAISAKEDIEMDSVRDRIEQLEQEKQAMKLSRFFNKERYQTIEKAISGKKALLSNLEKKHQSTVQKIQSEIKRRKDLCEIMVFICKKYKVNTSDFKDMLLLSADEAQIESFNAMASKLSKEYFDLMERAKFLNYKMGDLQLDAVRSGEKDFGNNQLIETILEYEFPEGKAGYASKDKDANKRGIRKHELANLSYKELTKIRDKHFLSKKETEKIGKVEEEKPIIDRLLLISEILEKEFPETPEMKYDTNYRYAVLNKKSERRKELGTYTDDDLIQLHKEIVLGDSSNTL